MPGTMEVDRRSQRRYDTGLATTYQLDTVRSDFGFRAMVVASPEGEMLLGSMDEPLGRPLALAVSAVGIDADDADAHLLRLRDEHLNGDRENDLHVLGLELDGNPTYLGILTHRGQDIGDAFHRTVTGLHRILETT